MNHPELPPGAVYLGLGKSFTCTEPFEGWVSNGVEWSCEICRGSNRTLHYAAPRDSAIARSHRSGPVEPAIIRGQGTFSQGAYQPSVSRVDTLLYPLAEWEQELRDKVTSHNYINWVAAKKALDMATPAASTQEPVTEHTPDVVMPTNDEPARVSGPCGTLEQLYNPPSPWKTPMPVGGAGERTGSAPCLFTDMPSIPYREEESARLASLTEGAILALEKLIHHLRASQS